MPPDILSLVTGKLLVQHSFVDHKQSPGKWQILDLSHEEVTDLLGYKVSQKSIWNLSDRKNVLEAVRLATRGFRLPTKLAVDVLGEIPQKPGDGILWIRIPLDAQKMHHEQGVLPMEDVIFRLYAMLSK